MTWSPSLTTWSVMAIATSRAAVVSRALERERRRKVAERDAAILASAGTDTDLDSLAEYAVATSMDDLD